MLRTFLSRRVSARRAAPAECPTVGPLVRPAARVRSEADGLETLEDRRLLAAAGFDDSGDGGDVQGGVAAFGADRQSDAAGDHTCCAYCHGGAHGGGVQGFPTNPEGILGAGGGTGDYDGSGLDLPLGQTFALNSNPDADHIIYLDFDGHTTSGTAWNSGRGDFTTPMFSQDSNVDEFSDDELRVIQETWLRISEQFLPFDVNVTTAEPELDRLINDGGADTQWGVRVVFGGSFNDWLGSSAGGVAYVGSFDDGNDTPTYVFEESGNNANGFTVAGAHEIGHTLGLSHDGTSSQGYYGGHGSGETAWGAVMGVSYGSNVIQFSRGEYEDADQQQDDLQIITTQNGFGYRDDDFGDTPTTAGALIGGRTVGPLTEISQGGIIERNTDFDVFAFTTTTGGDVSLGIAGPVRGQTLDVVAEIYTADGDLVARSAADGQLDAFFDLDLAAGSYLLVITGGGNESDSDKGYSDYGSIGSYTITGVIEGFEEEDDDGGGDGGGGDDGGGDDGGDDGDGDGGGPDTPEPRPRPRGKVKVYGKRLNTNENGKSAKFRVKLNRQPTDNVVIRIRISDLTEGAIVTEKLVFTPENWNQLQTVRVFGMDDSEIDGAERFKVLTTRASSDDAAYDRVNVKDMRGVNRDNDSANRIRDMKDRYREQFRDARREARREQRREERRADRIARREARKAERRSAPIAAAAGLPPRDASGGDADKLFGDGDGGDLFGGL